MSIQSFEEIERALLPFVPLVKELTGKDTTLQRIKPLMAFLGNPQKSFKAIHIAGTSGKTSTAYFTASLLRVYGVSVGLTVSPHVDAITERVQINGQQLSAQSFGEYLEVFLKLVNTSGIKPSYFELLYAFAMWVFAQEQVEYAVVETGVGGLHDATNVLDTPDKICVITDIGLDHQRLLGNSISEIATQKLGIVHEHNTVYMYEQNAKVMAVVKKQIQDTQGTLRIVDKPVTSQNKDIPMYQMRNWNLARAVAEFVGNRDRLKHLTSQELNQTMHTYIPARMDIVTVGNKQIVMDGAHNQQKLLAFIASFERMFPNVKPPVLIALKHDKDFEHVVPLIAKFAQSVIVTAFRTTQDLPVQSMPPEELAQLFAKYIDDVAVISDIDSAYDALLSRTNSVGIVTGSFYLLSQVRHTKRYHDQTDSSH